MSDVTLLPVHSGYNLNNLNLNFSVLEEKINQEILHRIGGNNTMSQQLDMNSNRIINLPAPESPSDPARLSDLNGLYEGLATEAALREAADNALAQDIVDAVNGEAIDRIASDTALQNQINDRIRYSEVVNNLSSGATNLPLSANQGRILKQLIDNITAGAIDPNSGAVTKADDISFFSSADFSGYIGGQQFSLKTWHPGLGLGSGLFYWDPDLVRNSHDGGHVISPTVPAPSTFTSSSEVEDYLNGVGDTAPGSTGCYVRVDKDVANVCDFGARADGTFNDTPCFTAAAATGMSLTLDSQEYSVDGTVINLTMSQSVISKGHKTKVFVDAPEVSATTDIFLRFSSALDGSDRKSTASVGPGIHFIRKSNKGGVCVRVNATFSLAQSFRVEGCHFDVDSTLTSSNLCFGRALLFDNLRVAKVTDCVLYGNYDSTISSVGQDEFYGIESSGPAGDHSFIGVDVFNFWGGYRFGDGVEGFRVAKGNIVHCSIGVNAEVTSTEPGGWVEDVHINCVDTGLSYSNRGKFLIKNCAIFRASDYYGDTDWIGVKLVSCTDFFVQSNNISPQEIIGSTGDTTGVEITNCVTGFITGQSFRGNKGLTSFGGNQGINLDQSICVSVDDYLYSFDDTDTQVFVGDRTFLASNSLYGNFPEDDARSFRKGPRARYTSLGEQEDLHVTGAVNLLLELEPHRKFYNVLEDAGPYVSFIRLRTDFVEVGESFSMLFNLPASSNPTVRIQSGNPGTTILNITNPDAVSSTVSAEFYYDGASWKLSGLSSFRGITYAV